VRSQFLAKVALVSHITTSEEEGSHLMFSNSTIKPTVDIWLTSTSHYLLFVYAHVVIVNNATTTTSFPIPLSLPNTLSADRTRWFNTANTKARQCTLSQVPLPFISHSRYLSFIWMLLSSFPVFQVAVLHEVLEQKFNLISSPCPSHHFLLDCTILTVGNV
jgi:hypothetical protein